MSDDQARRTNAALNVLAKWRGLFAGWQLGTRPKGDPESDAVRDHRELTIMLRAESNALVALLLQKGVFTEDEWSAALEREAKALAASYERRFPGVVAHDYGLSFDPAKVAGWMKGWRP
jgi:hypothetical protein